MDINRWLEELRLVQYAEVFAQNDIDDQILLTLTADDLKELGINSLGHRVKILSAIETLKKSTTTEEKSMVSAPWDLSGFPSIFALPFEEYLKENHPVLKLWHACDVVELTLRLMVTIGVAELQRDGELPKEMRDEFRMRIEEPTLGKWRGMAEVVAKRISRTESVAPELAELVNDVLVPLLDGSTKPPTPETSFSALRNQLAHGGGITKSVGSRLLTIWVPKFEAAIARAAWLGDLSLVIRKKVLPLTKGELERVSDFGVLRGPNRQPLPYQPDDPEVANALQDAFERGEEVIMVRGRTVLPLWPLTLYGFPRSPDPDAPPSRESAPQVYVRRGEVRLQFTPVGSEELAQSEGDETSLSAFLRLFRLDEVVPQEKEKVFEVRGFEADIRRDAEGLVGRASELEVIRNALSEKHDGVLWLTGPAGIGKSYLLARITAELLETPSEKALVLPYRFKTSDDRCSRNSFLHFAIERIKAWDRLEPAEEGENGDKKQKKPIEELKERLSRLGDSRVIFILDGLDEITERDLSFADEIPLGLMFPGVTWLCAGRPERGLPEVFTPERCQHLFPEGVPPMSIGDIRTMLLEKIGTLRKRLLQNDHEEEDKVINPFIERVAEHARGLPLYVRYVVGDILGNRFRALDAGERLPPSLEAYHEELLRRCSVGTLHQVMTPLAATLAAAKEPLTVEALAALLKRRTLVPGGERGPQLVRQGLSAIASMLRRATTPEGMEGYTLYHYSLRQHMAESETSRDAVDTARGAICEAALNVKEDASAPYLYRQGVTHLLEANHRNDALQILTNFDLLMSRLMTLPRPVNVRGISEDWRRVLATGAINGNDAIWEEFWQTKEHLLLRCDEEWPAYKILLQLAWEHADESPVTRAAEAWLDNGRCDWTWMRLKPGQRPQNMPRSACIRVLEGHGDWVAAVAVTPDGKWVVSGALGNSRDTAVRVWNLGTGECLKVLEGHTKGVSAVAVTGEGKRAVSAGSLDDTLRVWDLETGECVWVLEGHKEPDAVAIADDGKHAVSGGRDNTLRVWDLEIGQCLRLLEGHTSIVTAVALTKDGKQALSASWDSTLRLWDIETGKCLRILESDGDLGEVAMSGDGKLAVCEGKGYILQVWDLETGKCLRILEGHTGNVTAVAMKEDGKRVVSVSWDLTLRIWDLETGECLRVLKGPEEMFISLAVTSDGRWGVSGSRYKNTMSVWDLEADESPQVLEGHTSSVLAFEAVGNEKRAVSGCAGGTLRVWDLETAQCLHVLEGGRVTRTWKKDFAVTPDGKRAIYGSQNFTLRVWDLETGECLHVLDGHKSSASQKMAISSVVVSPDGKRAMSKAPMEMCLWNLETGECLKVLDFKYAASDLVIVTQNRKQILIANSVKLILVWDLETLELLRVLEGHTDSVNSLAVTADGKRVVSGSKDKTLRVWDPETGECLWVLEVHTGWVESVAVTADGKRAVSESYDRYLSDVVGYHTGDRTLRVWNLETGKCESCHSLEDALRAVPQFRSLTLPPKCREADMFVYLNHRRLGLYGGWQAYWCAEDIGSSRGVLFSSGIPAVFESVGVVDVLRTLDIVEGNRVLASPKLNNR